MEFMTEVGPKSHPEGDRALIVAKKRGNARGAKGGRELTIRKTEPEPIKTDVVPFGAVRVRANASLERSSKSDPTLCNGACMPGSPWTRVYLCGFSTKSAVRQKQQLESRMREIRQSGSEGGGP